MGDGSGNWCGIVLEGGCHYLVRDGGHWPQMSETEQICAIKRGEKLRPCVSTEVGGGVWDGYLVGCGAGICNRRGNDHGVGVFRGC